MEAKTEKATAYKIFRAILGPIYKLWYSPKIIGAENIPKTGRFIIVVSNRGFQTIGSNSVALDAELAIVSVYQIENAFWTACPLWKGPKRESSLSCANWRINNVYASWFQYIW